MAITVTQISNSQTFGAWLSTTNRLAEIASQNAVTTDSTSNGSLTSGNGFVSGHFGAGFLYAANGLVGGNVSSNGELLILSNTRFQYSGSNLVSVLANTTVQSFTAVVNSFTVTSNTVTITGNVTFANTISVAGNVTFQSTAALIANGAMGSNGQILTSNGTGLYWANAAATGVTNVATGSGLTGGPITSTGTVSVLANSGITANATGLFVAQGTGTVVNATGVHVNSSYIATIAANSATGSLTNAFTVGTASFFVANGNFGVGNSSPTTRLSVNGTTFLSANVTIANGAALIANGAMGTAGQVLTSNGTGLYWSSGGGGGNFNVNISNSVGFAANSTLSPAYTAPGTAGFRYIVHSVHVTNIGGANTSVTGKFQGSTYANISFATTVPVPADSSVELLKMPKVMQPSDILNLQVADSTALHATITLEAQAVTNFFGAGVDVTDDITYTDLYTATGNAVLQSVLLSNDDGVNDVKARVVWTDGSNNIQGYYCFDLIIPADSTVEVLEQPKFLQSGFKVRVYANVGGRLEAIIAGRLI